MGCVSKPTVLVLRQSIGRERECASIDIYPISCNDRFMEVISAVFDILKMGATDKLDNPSEGNPKLRSRQELNGYQHL